MKKTSKLLKSAVLLLATGVIALSGCTAAAPSQVAAVSGGTIFLKVNPAIAISYDNDGNVTDVEARNQDAKVLLETYTDFQGKTTKDVVTELVAVIGNAGYFVDDVDGESRQITIEIEKRLQAPYCRFLKRNRFRGGGRSRRTSMGYSRYR